MSSSSSSDEGESSNLTPYVTPQYSTPMNPFFKNFAMNMPAMVTYYQNLEEASTSSISPKKKRNYIKRDRLGALNNIMRLYFNPSPERVYSDPQFRTRFRMRRDLFERIVAALANNDHFFQQRPDACGVEGFTPLHKCVAAIRHLAYGCGSDQLDEFVQMGATTVRETVKHFVKAVINVYKNEFLRPASPDNIQRLKFIAERRGFPGMLGSIDCMHWEWKNCPKAWKGQYQGRSGKASVILEAVASYDTHIWHAFFGMAGSNNDINVLDKSDLFHDVCEGRVATMHYEVNGNPYTRGYYLTDGIYPKWAAFMPAYKAPNDPKEQIFTQRQESYRKDVERAFGILQARFAVIQRPSRYWSLKMITRIMIACIILHNMIVEDERHTYGNVVKPSDYDQMDTSAMHFTPGVPATYDQYRATWGQVRSRALHEQLKHDLTEHIARHVELEQARRT